MGALQVILLLCLLDLKTCYKDENSQNTRRTLFAIIHPPSKCTFITHIHVLEPCELSSHHEVEVDLSFAYLFLIREHCHFNAKSFVSFKCISENEIPKHVWKRRLILLMLLMGGNIKSNPVPKPECLYVPSDFTNRPGLKVVHLNVCSLMPKIDFIRIWAVSTKADIIAVLMSEPWLKKTISDKDVAIDDYNMFRADRKNKGGGVGVFEKSRLSATLERAMTVPKCFEMLTIDLKLGNTSLTVACYYRPPSANTEALPTHSTALADIVHQKEIIVIGDFNWNWLTDVSNDLKVYCDS